jgi:RNA polymerase sigma factor (sigma-70 family)
MQSLRKRLISLAKPQAVPDGGNRIVPFERHDRKEPGLRDSDRRKLFDSVFMAHVEEAFRLARWVTGNGADAEDVVQEAALRAYRAMASFAGINARAWTLTVVRNTAYSWLAKNRPAAVVFTEDLDADQQEELERPPHDGAGAPTPERLLIDKMDMGAVRAAIAALPPAFREAIVLRELHELNYREIAEVTGVPIGTVMSRLARARQMLIAALRNEA